MKNKKNNYLCSRKKLTLISNLKNYFIMKYSILNFQLSIIIAALLLAASCNFSNKNKEKQSAENAVVVPDTTFVAPTDSVNPQWNAKLDSMLRVAAAAKEDSNLALTYYRIGNMYEGNNSEIAKKYYLKCKSLSEHLNWNRGMFLGTDGIAIAIGRDGLLDSALVIAKQALELAKKLKNYEWTVVFCNDVGQMYFAKGWNETALNYFMEAVPIIDKSNVPRNVAGNLYESIAKVYNYMNSPEKAIEYANKSYEILKASCGDAYAYYSLKEIGLAYAYLKQYEKSNEYLMKAMKISLQQNDFYMLETIYLMLANNNLMVFNLDKAKMYLNKMLELRGSEDNIDNDFGYLWNLSKVEELSGNFEKSEKYALRAFEIANKKNFADHKSMSSMTLAELSVAQHKFKDNIKYSNEIDKAVIQKSLETSLQASEEMQAKYDTEKKNLEIAQQKQIIKNQNLQRGLLAGGVGVSIVILALLWYLLRLRNRRNRALTERNDVLAEMNATKDKFFSIISHDLKNPAIAQRDALQLLIKNTGLWDVSTLAKYYEGLLETAEGQVELVYNLLNWAQIQTGRMTFAPATFNLYSRLRSDISIIRKMAENKGITFIADIPEDVNVVGDSNMLAIVIRNLLTNAVKFTPKGGTITLKATPNPSEGGEFSLPFGEGRGGACISVSDTGVGMSEEQIRNLFQLDSRNSRRGTADEQGSGLGLIVCKELLEKHGSEFHIESTEGKGSRFEFTISA